MTESTEPFTDAELDELESDIARGSRLTLRDGPRIAATLRVLRSRATPPQPGSAAQAVDKWTVSRGPRIWGESAWQISKNGLVVGFAFAEEDATRFAESRAAAEQRGRAERLVVALADWIDEQDRWCNHCSKLKDPYDHEHFDGMPLRSEEIAARALLAAEQP